MGSSAGWPSQEDPNGGKGDQPLYLGIDESLNEDSERGCDLGQGSLFDQGVVPRKGLHRQAEPVSHEQAAFCPCWGTSVVDPEGESERPLAASTIRTGDKYLAKKIPSVQPETSAFDLLACGST